MPKNRKKILYIEDDPETAAMIAEELAGRGFDVHTAPDGMQGFSAIIRSSPDLVLCGLRMPAASGFTLLKRLTVEAPRFWNMPFIFLSATTDRDVELMARRLGADDFITKPVDVDMLAAIVASRLARVAQDETRPKRADVNSRETEVLRWAARGKTSAEIAIILELSKRTVDFHFDNARMKLGTVARIDTVIRAVTTRLIDP